MTFTVIVHDAEEGGFWAEVPELPGCGSQGETLDELEQNITEAIIQSLQAHMEDEGFHRPRPVRHWSISVDDGDLVPA